MFFPGFLVFLVCLLALPLLAAPAPVADQALPEPPRRFSRTIRETVRWTGAQQILVTEAAGRIRVRGEDRTDIEFKGIQTAFHKSLDTARTHVTDVVLGVESRPESLRLHTRLPDTWKSGLSGRIDYSLKAPEKAPLALQTVTGNIYVTDMQGPLDAHTVDGDTLCRNVKGPVTIVSVTGGVTVDRCPRALSVRTLTGPVTMTLDTLEDNLEINTLSGPVRVILERGADVRLVLSTGVGAIDTGGPDDFSGRRVVEKTYGGGAHTVTVRSLTGSITIENNDDPRKRK
jgi:hypothetical protein